MEGIPMRRISNSLSAGRTGISGVALNDGISDIAFKSVSHERKVDLRPGGDRSMAGLVFFADGIGGDGADPGAEDGE